MENINFIANVLTEEVIANDILNSAKENIRKTAQSITKSYTPEVLDVLNMQLQMAIDFYQRAIYYMISNGYHVVKDINEQIRLDINNADKAINIKTI